MEFKDDLRKLVWRLQEILENAPCEEYCGDLENEMYADMQNLLESTQNYLESEEC